MLQPGMCSASVSETSTWTGPPGACATHSATAPSPAGGMFGPPTPDVSRRGRTRARGTSASRGSGRASSSMYATISPSRAREPGVARVAEPGFSRADELEAVLDGRSSARRRRSSRRRRRSPRSPGSRAARGRRGIRRSSARRCRCRRRPRRAASRPRRARYRSRYASRTAVERRLRASGRGRVSPKSQSSTSRAARDTTRRSTRRRTRRRSRPRTSSSICQRRLSACASSPLRSAVEPELAHQQRPVAGEVLQPRRGTRRSSSRRLEVDVERDEVEERQLQVLGRRVVDVGDEPVGVLVLDGVVQPLEVPLDACGGRCQRTIGAGISLPSA